MPDINALAARLDAAAREATSIPQLTTEGPLTLDEAYGVQAASVGLRENRGDRQVGVKLGFTSKAKAAQMGVDDVIIGVLTAQMSVPSDGMLDLGRLIHPRIEPEVAYRLGRDVDPHDPDDDPLTAVDAVAPALEIIDSRYADFRFTLEDVVADNTSAAAYVVGEWRERGSVDLSDAAVSLSVEGKTIETGSTRDILGHPDQALAAVKRMAAQYNITLRAGTIVLAGAATAAVPLAPGTRVSARVEGLGEITVVTGPGDD